MPRYKELEEKNIFTSFSIITSIAAIKTPSVAAAAVKLMNCVLLDTPFVNPNWKLDLNKFNPNMKINMRDDISIPLIVSSPLADMTVIANSI
jgi:hypothetical protein